MVTIQPFSTQRNAPCEVKARDANHSDFCGIILIFKNQNSGKEQFQNAICIWKQA